MLYYDGGIVKEQPFNLEGGYYIEKSGLIADRVAHSSAYDTIYQFNDGTFKEIAAGNYEVGADICYDYFWEGKAVTEEEYYASFDAIMDPSKKRNCYDIYYTIDQLLNDLQLIIND